MLDPLPSVVAEEDVPLSDHAAADPSNPNAPVGAPTLNNVRRLMGEESNDSPSLAPDDGPSMRSIKTPPPPGITASPYMEPYMGSPRWHTLLNRPSYLDQRTPQKLERQSFLILI